MDLMPLQWRTMSYKKGCSQISWRNSTDHKYKHCTASNDCPYELSECEVSSLLSSYANRNLPDLSKDTTQCTRPCFVPWTYQSLLVWHKIEQQSVHPNHQMLHADLLLHCCFLTSAEPFEKRNKRLIFARTLIVSHAILPKSYSYVV